MRTALFAASLALVAGTTLGCGGGDDGGSGSGSDSEADAPASATTEEFCAAFEDFYAEVSAMDQGDTAQQVEALKAFGEELEELGTPDDIPEDARDGFELTLDAIAGIPDDASQEDIAKIEEGFSEAESAQADAFDEYLTETCEAPSEAP